MIVAQNITKVFGLTPVLQNVSFQVTSGSTVGLLGRTASGKSTLMSIFAGCLRPDDGLARIGGFDVVKEARDSKRRLGYVPYLPMLYPDMTVEELLDFICKLRELDHRAQQIEQSLKTIGITYLRHTLISRLSMFETRLAGFGAAIVGHPEVLLMDDPTHDLEPREILDIRALIATLKPHHTILLASPLLHEVVELCEHSIILNKGHVVADSSIQELSNLAFGKERLRVRIAANTQNAELLLKSLGTGVYSAAQSGAESGTLDYIVESEDDIRALVWQRSAAMGIPVLEIRRMSISLEDVYLQLTGGTRD